MNFDSCVHGGLIDADGTVSCEVCDWCPICESVQPFDGEHCTKCQYVWGEDTDNTEPTRELAALRFGWMLERAAIEYRHDIRRARLGSAL